ncbi:MAG: hypothetical protein LUD68_07455 [Rikenellaceae bacterium]|nr:hypothetical protein [Rikenellaceae bacterium]
MEYTQIVEQCRKGEREAQMRFYELFHRSIYGSSLRIVGRQTQAEEVM